MIENKKNHVTTRACIYTMCFKFLFGETKANTQKILQ